MSWIEKSESVNLDLPAIFQVMSLRPEALEQVKRLNEVLAFGGSGLSRAQEEAIATVVASVNQCRYEALTHAGFLRKQVSDGSLPSNLLYDYSKVALEPRDQQMLDYVARLSWAPSSLGKNDLEELRESGFNDEQILSIVLVTCLANFMDRLANALGVDVPPAYLKSVDQWLTGPVTEETWLTEAREE
ncbi:MAG: peroxidase-related enzyme [Dehalococcoidia bacterium]